MSNLGKEKSKAEQLQVELFLKPKHAMRGGLADAGGLSAPINFARITRSF